MGDEHQDPFVYVRKLACPRQKFSTKSGLQATCNATHCLGASQSLYNAAKSQLSFLLSTDHALRHCSLPMPCLAPSGQFP